LPTNWSYKGCYTDGVNGRTLRSSATAAADMTAAKCIAYCGVRGYSLAGTEYSNECFCGNSIANGGGPAASGCDMPCSGAPGEACGGPNRLSVYEKAATTGGTTPAASGPSGWGSLGCYSDSVAARILPTVGIINGGPANMSAASCTAACAASNFKYAGTEYAGECFCGNALGNGHTKQDEGCDMACNGAPSEMCGGANRINVYEF
ncbi:WSC-domain-containing protein, partial [Lentithecium fluviatile CBS 122367]